MLRRVSRPAILVCNAGDKSLSSSSRQSDKI